jgi:hypothetical protein
MAQLVQSVKSQDAWFARYGQGLTKWVDGKTPGASQVVLTDAGLVYNIPCGKQVLVRQMCFGIHTVSDNCTFEIGYTSQPDGAGVFTPIAKHIYVATGNTPTGKEDHDVIYRPPIRVRYCDGARSITIRVDANDANCVVCAGWQGWWEDEIP